MRPQRVHRSQVDDSSLRNDRRHLQAVGPETMVNNIRKSFGTLHRDPLQACLPVLLHPAYNAFYDEIWRFIQHVVAADTTTCGEARPIPSGTVRVLRNFWEQGEEILTKDRPNVSPITTIVDVITTVGEPSIVALAGMLHPTLQAPWIGAYRAYGQFMGAAAGMPPERHYQAEAILRSATWTARQATRHLRATLQGRYQAQLAEMMMANEARMRTVADSLVETRQHGEDLRSRHQRLLEH